MLCFCIVSKLPKVYKYVHNSSILFYNFSKVWYRSECQASTLDRILEPLTS
eukprot:c46613_g1_i1 orf=1-150(-)